MSVALVIQHAKRVRRITSLRSFGAERNDVNHWVFLNCNFSKEQCMLPADDRMIETCGAF